MTAEQIIKFFKMKPLPEEGGYYVETYRAAERIKKAALARGFAGDRNLCTAILYLLTAGTVSFLHRLKSDEIFHFYLGDPVCMLQLHPDGSNGLVTLGQEILAGQRLQVIVPKDTWQGTFVKEGGRFALLGCTVAPGFEFADYQHGDREQLLKRYPERRDLILKLTR